MNNPTDTVTANESVLKPDTDSKTSKERVYVIIVMQLKSTRLQTEK